MWKKISLVFLTIIMFSCKNNEQKKYLNEELILAENIEFRESDQNLTLNSNGNMLEIPKSELPLTNVMVETSSAIAFLSELDAISSIKGIIEPNYIYNSKIQDKINANQIIEIGTGAELYVEKIIQNKPQLLIASSNPILAKYHQQLADNGIRILYLDEYKEESPLAQVEYIKIYGKLLGKFDLANSRFNEITKQYQSLKTKIAKESSANVSTLVNNMMGDVWFLPSKNALQSQLIADAKGNYIFQNQNGETALNLSFEEVYQQGKTATHWINVMNYKSLEQMKASNKGYEWFDAFKNNRVYSYEKRIRLSGANDFFEQGVVRPDLILNDLGKIFYPELFPKYELYFYQQLK